MIYTNERRVSDNGSFSFNHLFDLYMIKAEPWRYEKEYRVIADLKDATDIIVTRESFSRLQKNNYDFFFDCNSVGTNELNITLNSNAYQVQNNYTFGEEPEKMRNNMLGNAYSRLAKDASSIFLYELPKKSIKRVILGCCIEEDSKQEIYNDIREYENDVEILQAERHTNRFELTFS